MPVKLIGVSPGLVKLVVFDILGMELVLNCVLVVEGAGGGGDPKPDVVSLGSDGNGFGGDPVEDPRGDPVDDSNGGGPDGAPVDDPNDGVPEGPDGDKGGGVVDVPNPDDADAVDDLIPEAAAPGTEPKGENELSP